MIRWLRLLALGLVITCIRAEAHHDISAHYDSGKRASVEGVVREFQFINPHPILIVDVTSNGKNAEWRLEMDNRFELVQVGMSADTLKPGDRVVVEGRLARDGRQGIYVMRLDRPSDGFRYEQIGLSPRVRFGRSG
jgi:hypothetical protein